MVEFTTPQMGMVAILGMILFGLFGYEYRIPPLFTIILVPLIVGLGLGLALGIYVFFEIAMTAAVAIASGLVLLFAIGFEWATS